MQHKARRQKDPIKTLLSLFVSKQLPGNGRKLHIALDAKSGEIPESILPTEHVGDETALPSLLAKVDANVERFLADGAYDGQSVFDCLVANFGPDIEVVIPPTAGRLLQSKRREVRKTQSKVAIRSETSTSRTSLSLAE